MRRSVYAWMRLERGPSEPVRVPRTLRRFYAFTLSRGLRPGPKPPDDGVYRFGASNMAPQAIGSQNQGTDKLFSDKELRENTKKMYLTPSVQTRLQRG